MPDDHHFYGWYKPVYIPLKMGWFSFLVLPTLPAFAMPIGDKQLDVFQSSADEPSEIPLLSQYERGLCMLPGLLCILAHDC